MVLTRNSGFKPIQTAGLSYVSSDLLHLWRYTGGLTGNSGFKPITDCRPILCELRFPTSLIEYNGGGVTSLKYMGGFDKKFRF